MNNETLRTFCLSLKGVTEDVKWGHDLCFMVAQKLFCVTALEGGFQISFKVTDGEFEELSVSNDIIPAPYMARNKWISVKDAARFTEKEWQRYIRQSYDLVKSRLPKKLQQELE
jgi:predicted DNA-binding protein (MmcQ/YjbR family)